MLVHGATVHGSRLQIGPLDFGDYFRGLPEFLGRTGTPVKVVELSTDGSVGERAAVLKNYLDTDLRGQKVNLIAHSLGGLDSRYAITILKATQVASLTTVGTPHHGTPLADWAVAETKSRGFWYRLFKLVGYDMATRHFLPEISTSGTKLFNEKVPDAPGVKYFSLRTHASYAAGNMSYLLWFPVRWLHATEGAVGDDDGMVPFSSQLWGTELPSAELDHLGQMNHHELRFKNMEDASLAAYARIYEALYRAGL